MTFTRRQFIKTGVAGGLILSSVAVLTRGTWWGADSQLARVQGVGYQFLSQSHHRIFTAIIPVVLREALPSDPQQRQNLVERVVQGVDRAVVAFQPHVQQEIRDLCDLLSFPPTRCFVARVWPSWENASADKINRFLVNWRTASSSLLESIADALLWLIYSSWYGMPESWPAIGYSGPPQMGSVEGR